MSTGNDTAAAVVDRSRTMYSSDGQVVLPCPQCCTQARLRQRGYAAEHTLIITHLSGWRLARCCRLQDERRGEHTSPPHSHEHVSALSSLLYAVLSPVLLLCCCAVVLVCWCAVGAVVLLFVLSLCCRAVYCFYRDLFFCGQVASVVLLGLYLLSCCCCRTAAVVLLLLCSCCRASLS